MVHKLSTFSIWTCLALVTARGKLAAQVSADARLHFEVASVKPTQPVEPGRAMAMAHVLEMMPIDNLPMPDPWRLRIEGWSLRQIVAVAYRARPDKVSGPGWMDDARFEIEAKLPEGAKRDQAREMMQALLAERFGLELHRESRELSGFSLVTGKGGPRLEEFVPPAAPAEPLSPEESQEKRKQQMEDFKKAMQAQMQQRRASGMPIAGREWFNWNGVTTAQMADRLARMAGGPVVDETRLTGRYKVEIETWRATDDDPGQTVFQAVERLGLKLVPRKVTVDLIVIDKASRTPSPN